jgi:hypothetical protein
MEFRIAKAEFLRGLRLAQGIADRKSTMPMLANVLLRTQGKNQLLVAATDLNVSLTAELKSHNASDGGIAILAKSLFDLVANAPGDEVTLKKADNHWAEIKSGKVTYRIVGMPDRDFPKVPDHREASYATVESAVATSEDTSLSLAWLEYLGSPTLIETTADSPSRRSSPDRPPLASLSSLFSLAYALMVRVSAWRNPVRFLVFLIRAWREQRSRLAGMARSPPGYRGTACGRRAVPPRRWRSCS